MSAPVLVPGSTALSACASLVGAPLTHDFCSISLSDLLTPWPTIARRIKAAGRSDFVVALYNPKSGRRTRQSAEAQRILLRYRRLDTPVAIVKSAYRDRQEIQMVRLDRMKDCKIGMLTTVLIGNSSSYVQQGLMITPRGYANKYDSITGDVRQGEKAGRSLSMGLEGWNACVRQYLRDSDARSLRDIARYFDAPMGEILGAIGEAGSDDPARAYSAVAVGAGGEADVLEAACDWGRLRAVVRSEAGAVSEREPRFANDVCQLLMQDEAIEMKNAIRSPRPGLDRIVEQHLVGGKPVEDLIDHRSGDVAA